MTTEERKYLVRRLSHVLIYVVLQLFTVARSSNRGVLSSLSETPDHSW
jgi:hypothetical protein